MRSIGDPAFLRIFDGLVALANPVGRRKRPIWDRDGARWTFDRHSYQGVGYSFSTHVTTIDVAGRAGWCLLVVRDYWWGEDDQKAVRELRWARLLRGDRKRVMDWFKRQDPDFEGKETHQGTQRPGIGN